MNKIRATIVFSVLVAIGSASIFLSSCVEKSRDGIIIFTRNTTKSKNLNWDKPDSLRYISQAQIVELDPYKPGSSVKILTSDFISARSPQISYDGKYMLFPGQQKENDLWQICLLYTSPSPRD